MELETREIVKMAAQDNGFYERHFFPKAVRQASPPFHQKMDEVLWEDDRFVAFMVFRGGAKTTKLRLFTSKRIAYAISHTILFVSNSQDHSVKSLEWLKRNVKFNRRWADTYQLRPGGRWTGEDIEIIHGVDEYPIRVMAVGITGQLRGVNIDDHRPDLIVVDDPDNEETTGTPEQIKKTSNLFFGALGKSLAPRSDAPDAKMVLLQTPLSGGDLINTVVTDPQWRTLQLGCFDEKGESTWPERFPTAELKADKIAHINRNQLALWMREMECQIVPEGGASFTPENIQYYDLLPEDLVYIIAIDPASSDAKTADDQVIGVLGANAHNVYLVEYTAEKGEMPEVAIMKVLEYIRRYQPLGVYVESIAYQRVLAHLLELAMRQKRIFSPVHRIQDKRSKPNRILQAIGQATGQGRLKVRRSHDKFLTQYMRYSPLSKEHEDVLDMVSIGLDAFDSMSIQEWGSTSTEVAEVSKKVNIYICP